MVKWAHRKVTYFQLCIKLYNNGITLLYSIFLIKVDMEESPTVVNQC